ncbi:MAG TPA: carboxypeptidase regulatory-like domain-containing protein, partial [Bacteroidota bacterium]|nr:carboxypeptidase regulatory-like domain-containing protein [Bacteroidota bacterium]
LGGTRILVFLIVHDRPLEDLLDGEEGDHDLVTSTFTDQNGAYSVMLSRAHYIVGALMEGFFPQFWDHKNSPLEANIISLEHDTSGVNFDLNPSGSAFGVLSGTMFSAVDSSRLRGLILGFHKPAPDSAFSGIVIFTNTDLSGNYLLQGMPFGYYVVLALPRGEFVPTFYSTTGGTLFHDSATAVGVFGDSVGGINIYARPDSVQGLNSVSGTVQTGSPTIERAPATVGPLSGAIITIISQQTHAPVGSALTLADGSYAVAGLAPGSYTVVFQKPGKSTAASPVSLAYNNNAPSTLTLNAQLTNQSGGPGHIGTMSVQQGWNLISLPVTVADQRKTAVFPNSVSPAFRYDNSGYVVSTDLDYSSGYWVRFPLVQAFTLQGAARTSQTIPVRAGWNMIGSVSTSVPVSAIQASSPNLIRSGFFSYDLGYTYSSSILPGRGYWVKTSGSGTLTLQSGPSMPPRPDGVSRELSELNSITIRDAAGFSQVLYFGRAASSPGGGGFEMPPVAPPEAFDVRFASQRFAEIQQSDIRKTEQYPILIQSSKMPLTLKWSIRTGEAVYRLTDGSGKSLIGKPLSGTGSATIDGSSLEKVILEARPALLPKAFALHQNFPNPFNPSAIIQYELPQDALVTLKVYNILGQETASLINEFEYAGYKSATFNAINLPSGVYFYRLQAGRFVDVKKMVLIR